MSIQNMMTLKDIYMCLDYNAEENLKDIIASKDTEISNLKDKLHRRNTQIKNLKKRIAAIETIKTSFGLK